MTSCFLKTKKRLCRSIGTGEAKSKTNRHGRTAAKEASKAIFDADTLTTALAELLIDRVLVYPDKRMEIAYKNSRYF